MTDLSDSIRAQLQAYPWTESVPRLLVYVRAQARRLVWAGRRGGEMPQGREAEDIVYGAIAKVLDGSRGWDPAREPDLERYLRSICDSELNHLAVGAENRRIVRESRLAPDPADGGPAPGIDSLIAAPAPGPLEALINREAESEAEKFRTAFLAFLVDDPPLAAAVGLMLDGTAKPAMLAASLGMDVTEVYNMRKRLQRRLTEFMTEWRDLGERKQGGPS